MKIKIISFLVLTVISITVRSQITFQKTYNKTIYDFGTSIEQTSDSGYVVTGYSGSMFTNSADVYLVKTDMNGNLVWDKTYGGTLNDYAKCVKQTTDGGYIIVGGTKSFGASTTRIYLLKVLSNGSLSWTKTFSGANYGIYQGNDVKQTTDGGYIITGTAQDGVLNTEHSFLIKTDSNGNLLWTRTYVGGTIEFCSSVQQTFDGGYIVVGNKNYVGTNNHGVYLLKTDSTGSVLWSKMYGRWVYGGIQYVQQTSDSGYVIATSIDSIGAGANDVYIIKTDPNGDTLWTKTYGGPNHDYGLFVQQTLDNGYLITGNTSSSASGIPDAYIIKTDSNGDTLWTKAYGGTDVDYGNSAIQTFDNGYILTGTTISWGGSNWNIYLIKTDSNGNSGCNERATNTIVGSISELVTNISTIDSVTLIATGSTSTIVANAGIAQTSLCSITTQTTDMIASPRLSIAPNPFTSETTLTFNYEQKNLTIKIIDMLGKEMRTINFSGKDLKIERADLKKGIYFLQIISEKKDILNSKILIQ